MEELSGNQESKMKEIEKEAPQHLIESILCRLPVKSLVRFMSISQCWNSLMSSSALSLLRSNVAMNILILNNSNLFTIDHSANRLINVTFPFSGPNMQIWGSCKGVICLSLTGEFDNIFAFNPMTCAFRQLPNPSYPFGYSDSFSFGLGFSSNHNDFKFVLAVAMDFDDIDDDSDTENVLDYVEIFSFNDNSWKKISCSVNSESYIVCRQGYRSRAVHLDGVLYWHFVDKILAFDIDGEHFYPIPSMSSIGYLGVLKNRLSFTNSNGIWIFDHLNSCWVGHVSFAKQDIRPLYELDTDIIAKKFGDGKAEEIVRVTLSNGEISTPLFTFGDGLARSDEIAYVEDLFLPMVRLD